MRFWESPMGTLWKSVSEDHRYSPTPFISGLTWHLAHESPGPGQEMPQRTGLPCWGRGMADIEGATSDLSGKKQARQSEINRSRKWCLEQLCACPDTPSLWEGGMTMPTCVVRCYLGVGP